MHSEIVEAFAKLQRDNPNRRLIYLPASNGVVTAADLAERASAVRLLLATAGVGRNQLVLSAVGNAPLAFAVLLATRTLDCALMPLDAGTVGTEIATLAAQFGPAAVIVPATADIPGYAITTGLDASTALRVSPEGAHEVYPDIALLKLTSGSSGQARATLTSESAVVSDGRAVAMAMDIQRDDIQIAAIPCSHSYGIGNLVMPLLLQGTAVSLRSTFVPHRVPDDARAVGARHLPGAPYMFEHFTIHLPQAEWPPALNRMVSAGAPLHADAAHRFRAKFGVKVHSFYGTSETGGISFDASDAPAQEGMVGTALPGVTVALVQGDDSAAASGRVHVRSAAVSRGYAGDVEDAGFVDGGFLTSDLGAFDAHGRLTLLGRVSSFVNVAGRKVQPEEVERVLRQFPDVADVRVIGVGDAVRGERLVACIVAAGNTPSSLELRSFCSSRLAAHKIPRVFVMVDAIPLTGRGKTDRQSLLGMARTEMARLGML